MYQVKFNDITSMHGQTNQTIQQWGESLKNLQESIASLANQSELQGKAMTSAKSYMTEVHGTFIQTLTLLMNEYTASFLLYKDGYYQIDTHNHAELPEDVYKGLHSDLGKSKQRFEQQLEQLTAAKLRVAGLVNYQGSSHTKTKFTYEKLMKDIKHLDESITQYEEMHARQDLQAFKELLAATKSLLAEHSSRDRSMGSYQVGDFRQLPSMNRFMLAVQQSAIYLNNHMPQFQAAQEREQLRVESIYAEERTKQGAMNLFFGILTLAVGLSALVISGGTAIPIVTPWLETSGYIMYLLGSSNAMEGVHNISLGIRGDGQTHAVNPLRDTIFMGDVQTYNSVVQVVSLTTGILIPIAHTQSILQGTWQFGWGLFGGHTFGKIGYHGTKLLGGSEEMAQMMDLFGNLIGGYTFSKLTQDFSLNRIQVPKVTNENVQPSSNLDRVVKLDSNTVAEIKNIIEAEGYSLKEFSDLLAPERVLTSEEEAVVRKVREIIGLPEAGTWMTKVISTEDVDPIIKGIKKEIYGFTSAKEHSDALGTLNEVYKGNRLDYPGTPFTRNGTKYYAKIIFSLDNPEELIIPYKENYEGVSPFTGRGFTGAQEIILPEYRFIKGHSFRGGDMINIYNRNGEVVQQFIFDELNDMWKHTK
ncbi:T7SS effector LXG polymorphic toxin [uncultured Granulicatella sp.]|uniref:T7SS effector LXG polymorphic toxin n=1 Tax=uncultured Granulicatella sp. TaxID=316089 RepID=UPI0028D8F54E|nr:T7SS effector LXG polymorphic toxin [uncultured Granulicatella sp.]